MKPMKKLSVKMLAWAMAIGAVACSTGPKTSEGGAQPVKIDAPNPSKIEPSNIEPSKIESPIVSNCRLSTLGLPCDPDGNGAATECEGVCWIDDAALVSCQPVAQVNLIVTDLNGRICGDGEGRDCGQSCENGACVQKNARLGTACRPNANSSTCEGVCTLVGGEPECDEVTVCSSVGISDDGCSLRACDFESFALGCKDYELENSVCEASQTPVIEAGVSSEPADAAVNGDAIDASPATNTPELDDAGSGQTSGAQETNASTAPSASDTAQSSIDGGADAGPRRDAGAAGPPDVAPSPAAKVVGGACSTVPGGSSPGASALLLAALVLVTTRRKRSDARLGG